MQDARAVAALSHPNIATLWDVGEADGQTYLAYEFAAGRSLREEAGGAAMNPRRALDLAIQIADGVADAHSRTASSTATCAPTPIIVTAKGSAKILDFGLAQWTRGGACCATARPRIPTRCRPSRRRCSATCRRSRRSAAPSIRAPTSSRIGTLTYELVTGKNPFAAATAGATVMNVIQGKFTPASV